MVNKKTRKYYYRAYREKKADLYKVNDAPRKKIERERRKNWSQKGTKCSRRRNSPCQGIPLKKKMSEQLQVSTAASPSGTTSTTSSAFSTKRNLSRSIHKTERSLPSSPRTKADVI